MCAYEGIRRRFCVVPAGRNARNAAFTGCDSGVSDRKKAHAHKNIWKSGEQSARQRTTPFVEVPLPAAPEPLKSSAGVFETVELPASVRSLLAFASIAN